jgi:uncharacterized repeat protein (TIGR03803 family)
MTPSGTLTTLHSFAGTDGSQPEAVLLETSPGQFYGAAWSGGLQNAGTLFSMTADGAVTLTHGFQGAEGANPGASVQNPASGEIYTSTFSGGSNGDGAIFGWM